MESIILTIAILTKHLMKNLSNYLLLSGVFLIYRYICVTYGIETLLLALGVLFIALSIILEISKKNVKKIR